MPPALIGRAAASTIRRKKKSATGFEPVSAMLRQRGRAGRANQISPDPSLVPEGDPADEPAWHRHRMRLMTKKLNRITNFALGGVALALATSLLASAPATSKPNFDGLWSVVIITEKGSCDRAYRYPIRITGGNLLAAESVPARLSGRVTDAGVVNVTVAAGSKSAIGTGRLAGAAGIGSWKGGDCAGTWQAERRGS